MQYFARVVNGVVFEVVQLPDDVTLASAFAPDFVAALTACDSSVVQGSLYDGHTFSPPPPPPPPPAEPLIIDSAKSLSLAQAKAAAARGDSAAAFSLLLQHIESA